MIVGRNGCGLPCRRFSIPRVFVAVFSAVTLAGCGNTDMLMSKRGFSPSEYGVSASDRVVDQGQPVPRGGGVYRVGKPYTVRGITYVPRDEPGFTQTGIASWYGSDFHGRKTANGEIYNMHALSAAHTTMPLPAYARVTNLSNGRSVVVRVNDRGPYHSNRIIDLSSRAANLLKMVNSGLGRVRVDYLGRAPLHGRDESWLRAQVKENGQSLSPERVAQLAPIPAWADQGVEQGSYKTALIDPVTQNASFQLRGGYDVASLEPVAPPRVPAKPEDAFDIPPAPAAAAYVKEVVGPAPLSLVPLTLPASVKDEAWEPTGAIKTPHILQVGSYRTADEAIRYRDALKPFGASSIDKSQLKGMTFYQVKVGPFANKAQAQKALQEAQKQGANGARLVAL